MDLTKKTVEELKAMAYDQLAAKGQAEQNLQILNQEIAKRVSEEAKKPNKEAESKN